jgi:integrase
MAKIKNSRGANGTGAIRQRKDGTWEARFSVGRHPGTGKQIQKSVYAKTQAEVVEKLANINAAIVNKDYKEPSKLTTGQWLDTWVDEWLPNVKPATRSTYIANINNHIKPAIGATPLNELDGTAIQKFYNKLSKSGRKLQKGQKIEAPPGLSPKTVKNIHATLHKALKQAVILMYIKHNPSDAAVLPDYDGYEATILTDDDIPVFLKAAETHRYGVLFMTTLFTGCRRGEILGLTWNNIDFTNKTILISKQLQRQDGELRLVTLKNKSKNSRKSRTISPPDIAFDYLDEHRKKQASEKLPVFGSSYVFTGTEGKPLDADAVYTAYKKFLTDNGLPNIRFHDLRHSAATLMIQNGLNIKAVQDTLGHHTAAFTLDVYGHVTPQMNREGAMRMDNYYKHAQKSG